MPRANLHPRAITLAVLLAYSACGDSPTTGSGGQGGTAGNSGGNAGGSAAGAGGSSVGSGGAAASGGSTGSARGGAPGEGGTGGTGAGGAGMGRGGAGGTVTPGSGGAPGVDAGGRGGNTGGPDAGPVSPGDAGGSTAELDRACTPKFTLRLLDTGPKGQIFTDAVGGNAEAFVQDIGRKVCRILYRKPDEVRAANSITLTIEDYDGVAAKSGDVGAISVQISTRHLQNVKTRGDDVAAEISGVLHHEMTHMYQHDDKPEANFPQIANMYESVADGVRIRNGFAPSGCAPSGKTGTWASKNYCTGGWFWAWAEHVYPGYIYKLNGTMKGRDGKAWSPADATFAAGKSIDDLWTEYQGAACCSGATRTCCPVLPR